MTRNERQHRLRRLDHFVVIDFEATCEENARIYPQEIIEFPAVLVDAATGRVLSEFRTYVRPRHHPRLTAYCINLTGIQQHQVDAGVDLAEALAMHDAWLRAAAGARSRFAVVTWGDWDCKTMLESECRFKGLAKPAYFDRWVNLRAIFQAASGRRCSLPEAVRDAGLRWEGRWHCGLDAARNAARLLAKLMRRGVAISVTGSLPPPPPAEVDQPPRPQAVAGAATYRICYCGVASNGGVMTEPGPLQGRRFYRCGNWTPERGSMCRFFLWAD